MGKATTLSRLTAILFFSLFLCATARAQAPSSIQFFMPDGSLPPRELRFTLTSDAGLVDTFFTDTRGRFLITRSQGLKPDAAYTVIVPSDQRTYATTVYSFKMYSIGHITIFLRPLETSVVKAAAIDLAEMDVTVPQPARDAYERAMRSLADGKRDAAITELNRALEIHPAYFRALNDLGVILMQLRRNDEAAAVFERAIKTAPRVYLPRLNLAVIRTRQGRYKEAVESLERLHKENPTLIEIRTPLADALMAINKLDEAETHLRAVVSNEGLARSSEGNARYLLGLLLNRRQQYREAASELSIAASHLPRGQRIRLQLGAALLQLGKYAEAESELLEAYRIGGSEMGAAQFLLGELYFITRKYDSARRAFEQYLIDVPKAPNETEVKTLIARIRTALEQK
jgi:Flp pilus assembly protein TadD